MKPYILSSILLLAVACNQNNKKQEDIALQENKTVMQDVKAIPEVKPELLISQAKGHFKEYQKQLVDSNSAVGREDYYAGDFSGDGRDDLVIYYSIEPTNGGNYLVGQGLMLYENNGDKIKFIKNYVLNHEFSFSEIKNNKIIISQDDYKENDPRCCPSIHQLIEVSIVGSNVTGKPIQ